MNVTELYNLTLWVEENITKTQIPQKYQALQQILQQNTQSGQQQPLESQKNDLFETIKNVPLKQLSKEQLTFLHALKIAQSIGEEGISIIEDIFYKNVIDVATTARKMQETYQNLTTGIKKLNQVKAGLEGYVTQEEYEVENEVLMRITFTGHAELSNVVHFKDWGKIWYEIGRGIAIAHNTAPEEVKIIGATSGSIVIELATIPAIAATTATIIYSALKLAEKVLDIKKKAEEIKNLQLQNKKLASDIAKEAEKEKEKGIEEITVLIVEQLSIKKTEEGDKVLELDKAIKHLVNFIESGGEVDFVLPENGESQDDDNSATEYKKLKEQIQEIHLLESKLKLLEAISESLEESA